MKTITATVAALLAFTGIAAAQRTTADARGAHFIENWDLNGDGSVALDELKQRRGDVFVTFDADEDGYLDAEEYVLFDEARALDQENAAGRGKGLQNAADGMRLEVNDDDNDGKVSEDEFIGNSGKWLIRLDRNSDGVVTSADFGRN